MCGGMRLSGPVAFSDMCGWCFFVRPWRAGAEQARAGAEAAAALAAAKGEDDDSFFAVIGSSFSQAQAGCYIGPLSS